MASMCLTRGIVTILKPTMGDFKMPLVQWSEAVLLPHAFSSTRTPPHMYIQVLALEKTQGETKVPCPTVLWDGSGLGRSVFII